MIKNPAAMWETGVQSLGWEDPLEKRKATYFSILAWGNPMARGAWRATVYGATKSQTRLSNKHFHTNSTESHLVLFFIFSARFFFFFFKMFFMWTIFKVFTEFGTILFPLYVLVFWPRGMWDLSSPASNQTRSPCFGGQSLIPWTTSGVPVILH